MKPMAVPLSGKRATAAQGQALVEFALVIPMLILLILAVIEAGRFVFYMHSLEHAAREGARYAIVHGENAFDGCPSGPLPPGSTSLDCDPDGENVKNVIRAASFGLSDAGGLNFGWPGDPRFPLYFLEGGSPGYNTTPNTVTVRLRYTYPPLVPIDFIPPITISVETSLVINN
ncbi:MAG TPA: TadE family protein [Candidatus Limnocylindria bacterium]|nr:TadE family protein [Candidatus Limnocylindria bacterium]